ncbi:uncharacterized protein CG7065-like [Ischnura elegans]|uniref:uncharacterized protein CG7065-like n=1 Tax=Ischnura elegans TaxID=197161 RepID=UPI001ED89A63|nr:uncharacterized protein CG7065-like [Ischnura elegans]XP_046398728.1 uncharacterized protein CG7065-like [Ischnura elegans]XP_046398729.1 uncharacterized protein CG7065-like [Ischnura elegans]XP_046398730.1 uncharacterized protein CG7065-like [Ischnura elegans]
MRDGNREDVRSKFSLSPVTVSSSSNGSNSSSVSPPKILGRLAKSSDATVKSSWDYRQLQNNSSETFKPRGMFPSRNYRSRSRSRGRSPQSKHRSRSRSRSLPKRYRSRSRSRSRGRVSKSRRSRSRSKSYRSRRSRSRSKSRQYRSRRSRSRSHGKSSRSRRSSSYSKSSSRRSAKSRSRSREHSKRRYKSRSKSPSKKLSHISTFLDLRKTWETFHAELAALESIKAEEEKLFDKDPEKHPDYNVEWKKFYKGRVQEILDRGDDPKLHNFESEWAYFWKFRMSELIKMDYERKKMALKRRLKLPEDAEMPLYLQARDSSGKLDPLPPKKAHKGLIFTLRIVTAVEEQLGSLGPRVNGLLSEAVSLQRIEGSDPDSLLSNPENFVLLETVKEKLLGQMQSKIVKKSLEGVVEEAIKSICELLQFSAPPNPSLFHNQLYAAGDRSSWAAGPTAGSQVNVPGVGVVDRIAIAQQIAEALVKQGKTDVTEAELQELVNGVVGMVEAQAAQEKEKEMAALKERLQAQESAKSEIIAKIPEENKVTSEPPVSAVLSSTNTVIPSETPVPAPKVPEPTVVPQNTAPDPVTKGTDALSILMSVVNSGIKKDSVEKTNDWSSEDSDDSFEMSRIPISSNVNQNVTTKVEKQDKNEKITFKLEFNKTKEATDKAPTPEKKPTPFGRKETPQRSSQAKKSPSPEIFKTMKRKVMAAARNENARKMFAINKNLSPFSSREETSNPLPVSDEEDEDQKIIGAWDSDSDIDLDSFGKAKGLAYDKVNVKKSPGRYEKNISILNKSKEVLQNTGVLPSGSIGTDMNLDAAIDNLMGELKNKTSKIEVISNKPHNSSKTAQNNSPLKTGNESGENGESMPMQIQTISTTTSIAAPQGYNTSYGYPQAQQYGAMQPGYYPGAALGYPQNAGLYYPSHQGAPAPYYSGGGNMIYRPPLPQWPRQYPSQPTTLPNNARSSANYRK